MATTEQITAWLGEAEAALHRLMTGTQVVSVAYEGHQVSYRNSAADLANLRGYIADLKRQLGQTSGRYRPVQVAF